MSYAHTLVKLGPGEKIAVGQSIRSGQCALNFGEVASIPLTMAQAEDVATQLRAWIDEQISQNPPPPRAA